MCILGSVTSILWLGFILMMVPRSENIGVQNQEKITVDCGKPLDFQVRQFPQKSEANKLQLLLKYSHKPLWPLQWLMTEEILELEDRSYSPSMKIAEMHKADIKGQGIKVVILGNTPVNCLHKSIRNRCHVDDLTTILSVKTKKPILTVLQQMLVSSSNTIASEVAGIIGMSGNIDAGGVGIAPQCHIKYAIISKSFEYASPEHCAARIISKGSTLPAEVFVHAWNLREHDYKRRVLHASNLNLLNFNDPHSMALKPHVMGSGMYGLFSNSCQCNEYANADSMFVFGSITYEGYLVPTSESCASLFGVTHSTSYGHYFYNNIVTISSTDSTYKCASKSETALSAAVAGGIIALIIDCFKRKFGKSPSISDLAFLLAFSSSSKTLQDKNILWFSNGIGLMYSQQAGFGLPNMLNVVALLAKWNPMEFPIIYEATRFTKEIKFTCGHDSERRRTLTYSSNLTCHFSISNAQAHLRIQLVSVELSAELVKRGALTVYLVSPAGTVSCILEGRPYDTANKKYYELLLRSNHFIGEQLEGQWSLRFYTYQEDSNPAGGEEALTSSKLSSSNPAPFGGVLKSTVTADNKLTKTEGNNQQPSKKRVTFSEVVTVWDGTLPQNPQVDNVAPLRNSAEPQQLRSILRKPKSGSSANGSTSLPKPPAVKNREPNMVNLNQIKIRFVLHKSLPLKLNRELRVKSEMEREKNFELLKAWVDFRHFLAQLNLQKGPKIGNQDIYSIQSKFVKTLAVLQKNNKIQSVFNVSPDRFNAFLSIADSTKPVQPVEPAEVKAPPVVMVEV